MSKPPLFSFDLQISPLDGREDKIDLALGKWILHTNDPAFVREDFLHYLASPPKNCRPFSERFAEHGWIFSRPQLKGPLRIRTNRIPSFEARFNQPLLFAGECHVQRRQIDSEGVHEFTLYLSLNALRFVRYQPVAARPISPTPANWAAPTLLQPEWQPDSEGEFSLDGKDNWLPDTSPFHAWANSSRWQHHLRRYLVTVGKAFDDELRRVANGQISVTRAENFAFSKVEMAWEFRAGEPTELVNALFADAFRIPCFRL